MSRIAGSTRGHFATVRNAFRPLLHLCGAAVLIGGLALGCSISPVVSDTQVGGGYYDGNRFTMTGSLAWQPDYHLTIDASAEHNSLSVQGSDFTADLYTARVKYAFTTKLYVGAFVQYNADTDQVVVGARVGVARAGCEQR